MILKIWNIKGITLYIDDDTGHIRSIDIDETSGEEKVYKRIHADDGTFSGFRFVKYPLRGVHPKVAHLTDIRPPKR